MKSRDSFYKLQKQSTHIIYNNFLKLSQLHNFFLKNQHCKYTRSTVEHDTLERTVVDETKRAEIPSSTSTFGLRLCIHVL